MSELMFQGQNWERLIAGWPAHPSLWFDDWRKTLVAVHAAMIDHGETVKAIQSDGNLTKKGMADAVANLITSLLKPRLFAMRDALIEMDEREAAIRTQIVRAASPQATIPSDVAMRTEVRAYSRSMSEAERMAFVAEQTDPLTVAALLEGPAYLSGITAAQRNALTDAMLRPEQQGLLADIETARQIMAVALRGAQAVADNALSLAGRPLLAAELEKPNLPERTTTPLAAGNYARPVLENA